VAPQLGVADAAIPGELTKTSPAAKGNGVEARETWQWSAADGPDFSSTALFGGVRWLCAHSPTGLLGCCLLDCWLFAADLLGYEVSEPSRLAGLACPDSGFSFGRSCPKAIPS